MTDVIDHLYRKAVGQEYGPSKEKWDRLYKDFKNVGSAGFMRLYGIEQRDESLHSILGRMAQDIAALQKERQ